MGGLVVLGCEVSDGSTRQAMLRAWMQHRIGECLSVRIDKRQLKEELLVGYELLSGRVFGI